MNPSTGTMLLQADATRLPFADACIDMIFTSGPYMDARTYGIGAQRNCEQWVEWMLDVVTELTRVCNGLVLVNCAGVTRGKRYWPGCEGLMWEWFKRGGNLWRPAYWHRVGIPGSGGKQWLRADIEYVIPFKRDAEWLPWADNTANGHPPKWAPGGEMSHRVSTGARVNQWGHPIATGGTGESIDDVTCGKPRPSHVLASDSERTNKTKAGLVWGGGGTSFGRKQNGEKILPAGKCGKGSRRADGTIKQGGYDLPTIANPGCLIKGIKVGGGLIGSKLAHENEAPFPEALAEWFIKSWCKPGGIVLDPFSGSGTTVAVARRLGRKGIGADLRMSQCELARRRLAEPERATKAKRVVKIEPGELTLFGGAT